MKYKLIAMDFDGTLLNDDKTISIETKNTLLNYQKNGYIIVGATARNLSSVKSVCDISLFDYLILNNGCYLYNVKESQGSIISSINYNDALSITNMLDKNKVEIDYCGIENYYYLSNIIKDNNYKFWKKINNIVDISESILRMNIISKDNMDLENLKNKIDSCIPNICSFYMQDSKDLMKWLVIHPKGISKATTLNKLGKSLNISLDEMIYFGDGPNDLEVIEKVGISVAMANALEIVKTKAIYITKSNNEDGIAIFLKKYIK